MNVSPTPGLKAAWVALGIVSVLPHLFWAHWMLTESRVHVVLIPAALTFSLFTGAIFVFMGFRFGFRHMYLWTVLLIVSFTVLSPLFWLFNAREIWGQNKNMPAAES
jgi:hypothetical protein